MTDESISVEAADIPMSTDVKPPTTDKTKLRFPNMQKKELAQVAKDIVANKIFTSNHLRDKSLLSNVFMPLIFGATSEYSKEQIDDIGMIYADYKDSGPSSINGYPIFWACRFVSKHDSKIIWDKVEKIEKLLKDV